MLFNSYVFIFLMLPISVAGYYVANRISVKAGLIWLLIVSLFFVGYTNYMYLLLLLPNMIVNYLIGYFMKRRKAMMICGVIFNVLVLLIFKYYNFFAGSLNKIFAKDFALLNLILPLGISFYTFKQISFIVDCYRDETLKCDPLEYGVYVAFYPGFTQGPITLLSEIIPQLRDESRKRWDSESASKGLYRFTLGLAKKVLIADTIARAVDAGYGALGEVNAMASVVLILGYTLQIYFDFSGYSDMAIGLGLLFNIELPENFNSPYKARSIDEFWDRWHITLTRFFTKYVYIPLGGSRKGVVRTYINVFLVFLLSGLWHGAEWSFVLWGVLHGVAMLISRCIRDFKKAAGKKKNTSTEMDSVSDRNEDNDSEGGFIGTLKMITVFIFVNIAWVFFRAADMMQGLEVIKKLFGGGWSGMAEVMHESFGKVVEVSWLLRLDVLRFNDRVPGIVLVFTLLILTLVCMLMPNSRQLTDKWDLKMKEMSYKGKTAKRLMISGTLIAVLFAWCVLSITGVTNYIYWNF